MVEYLVEPKVNFEAEGWVDDWVEMKDGPKETQMVVLKVGYLVACLVFQ